MLLVVNSITVTVYIHVQHIYSCYVYIHICLWFYIQQSSIYEINNHFRFKVSKLSFRVLDVGVTTKV